MSIPNWRNYGGIGNSEKSNSISINNLVADYFTLTNDYRGNFTITGKLDVNNETHLNANVYIKYLDVKGNTRIHGDTIIDGETDIFGNLTLYNKMTIYGDVVVGGNLTVNSDTFILGDNNVNGNITFTAIDSAIGLNTILPQSTFDIHGTYPSTLNVFSTMDTNVNTIVQTNQNKGITVFADASSAVISFYNENSIIQPSLYDTSAILGVTNANITYTRGNNLSISVGGNTQIYSKLCVSNRNSAPHTIFGESTVIHDISSGSFLYDSYEINENKYRTGNALSLVSGDISSNTFMNIITPSGEGIRIGGGSYNKDTSRSMGFIGMTINSSGGFVPSQTIIAGNSLVKHRSTVGINTFVPKVDDYVLDVNGPVNINNGEITMVKKNLFEIKQIIQCRKLPQREITMGTPYLGQSVLYTTNGGKSWSTPSIHINPIYNTNSLFTGFVYDISHSILAGENGVMLYSYDGYKKWYFLESTTFNIKSINAINIMTHTNSNPLICFSNTNLSNQNVLYYFMLSSIDILGTSTTTNIDGYSVFNISGTTGTKGCTPLYQMNINISCNSMDGFDSSYVFIAGNGGIQLLNISSAYFYDSTASSPTSHNGDIYLSSSSSSLGTGTIYTKQSIGLNVLYPYQYNHLYSYNAVQTYKKYNNDGTLNTTSGHKTICVGEGIITTITLVNGSWSYTNTLIPNVIFNSVYIYDLSNSIAVGDSGAFYVSLNNGSWTSLSSYFLNNSGLSSLIDPLFSFSSVIMSDINSIVLSKTYSVYDSINSIAGNSKILYSYLPDLFNHVNNNVLDVCGNMRLSGDAFVYDNMYITKNTLVGGNTNIIGNLTVGQDSSCNGNVYCGNHTVVKFIDNFDASGILIGITGGGKTIQLSGNSTSSNPNNIIIGTSAGQYDQINMYGNTFITDNLKIFKNTHIIGDSSMNGNVTVMKDISCNGNVYCGKNTVVKFIDDFDGNILIGATGFGGKKIQFSGSSTVSNPNNITIGYGTDNLFFNGTETHTGTVSIVDSKIQLLSGTTSGGSLSKLAGVYIREFNNNNAGYVAVNNALSGYLLKATNNSNVLNIDVSGLNLTSQTDATTGTMKNGIVILRNSTDTDSSYNIGMSWFDASNVFLKNYLDASASTTNQVVPSDVLIKGNLKSTSTLDSGGVGSGAFVVGGGVGISKACFIGTTLSVGGASTLNNTLSVTGITTVSNITDSTSSISGALIVSGGLGIAKACYIGSTTNATSTSTGALVVGGGVGIFGACYIGNNLVVNGNTTIAGNVAITGNATIGNIIGNPLGIVNVNANLVVNGNTTISGNILLNNSLYLNRDGLYFKIYDGNFNDSMTFTSTAALKTTGLLASNTGFNSNISSINIGTNGAVPSNGSLDSYTVEYTGYFFANVTGVWTFFTNSDDGSFLWIGPEATSGYTALNAIVQNGGNHGPQERSGTISLTSGIYYPIRILFGEGSSGDNLIVSFTPPSGTKTTNGTGYFFNIIELSRTELGFLSGATSNIQPQITAIYGNVSTIQIQVSNQSYTSNNNTTSFNANVAITGVTTVSNITDSTSSISGALIVSGGIGIAKKCYIGTTLNVTGASTLSTLNVSGITTVSNTTDSTISTNGALIVSGGIGIAKACFIGTTLNVSGASILSSTLNVSGASTLSTLNVSGITTVSNTTDSTISTNGALIVSGGIGIAKKCFIGTTLTVGGASTLNNTLNVTGVTTVSNITDSTSSISGALIVSGGIGIAKACYIGTTLNVTGASTLNALSVTGITTVSNTTDSTISTNGALIVSGGLGIAKACFIGTTLNVTGASTLNNTLNVTGITTVSNTTDSTSSISGALIVSGGLGIAKKCFIGSATSATSTSTGALVVSGGVGINGACYIGDNLNVTGSLTMNGTNPVYMKNNIIQLATTGTTNYLKYNSTNLGPELGGGTKGILSIGGSSSLEWTSQSVIITGNLSMATGANISLTSGNIYVKPNNIFNRIGYANPLLGDGLDLQGENMIRMGVENSIPNILVINTEPNVTINAKTIVNGTISVSATTGNIIMNNSPIFLKTFGDYNHSLVYDGTSDGPALKGFSGGRLGTVAKTDILNWNTTGAVHSVALNGDVSITGTTRFGGIVALVNNPLYLREYDDADHTLVYDVGINGPALKGNLGGKLGTTTKGDILTWNTTNAVHSVGVNGNLQIASANEVRLNNAPIYLKSTGDNTHFLQYTGAPYDGPALQGNLGGKIGTVTKTDILTWNSNAGVHRVDVGGSLQIGSANEIRLNSAPIYLKGTGDNNHFLQYLGANDGPALQGNLGGRIGTVTKTDIITWSSSAGVHSVALNGGVSITGSLTAGTTVITNAQLGYVSGATSSLQTQLNKLSFNNLANVTTGSSNVSLGNTIMNSVTTGSNNIGIGYQALANNVGASDNIAIGVNSGAFLSTNNNIAIGTNTGAIATNSFTSSTCIGVGSKITGSNQVVLGTATETVIILGSLNVTNNISIVSDVRLKNNINTIQYGLNEILELNPVSYNLKTQTDNVSFQEPSVGPFSLHLGLIAQDVKPIIPEIITYMGDEKDLMAISYISLIPILIKAIQEQNDIITGLKTRIDILESL